MNALFDKVAAGFAAIIFVIPLMVGCSVPDGGGSQNVVLSDESGVEQREQVSEAVENVTEETLSEEGDEFNIEGDLNERISYVLPENWISEDDTWTGNGRDSYIHHLKGDKREEMISEGVIFQYEVSFIEGGLQNTFDYAYAECVMNNPEPPEDADILYVPCQKQDLKDWEEIDFGDNIKGYRSQIVGVPESGEEMEEYYVVFESLNGGVYFRAVYSESKPVSREDQYAIVDGFFKSIEVE